MKKINIVVVVMLLSLCFLFPLSSATSYEWNAKIEPLNNHVLHTLYSGLVYTDDNGTTIDKTFSLKNCQNCRGRISPIIDIDNEFPLTIVDYNETSIIIDTRLDINSRNIGKNIYIRTYENTLNGKTLTKTITRTGSITPVQTIINVPNIFDYSYTWGTNTSTTNFSLGGDGYGASSEVNPWDACHDNTEALGFNSVNTFLNIQSSNFNSGTECQIQRTAIPFNTSSIPDNVTISDVLFYFYPFNIAIGDTDSQAYIGLLNVTPSLFNNMTVDDYDQIGSVDNPLVGGKMNTSDMVLDQYNILPLNKTGIGWIQDSLITDEFTLGLREGHDIEDTQIQTDTTNTINIRSSRQTGTDQVPLLQIIYTATVQQTNNSKIDTGAVFYYDFSDDFNNKMFITIFLLTIFMIIVGIVKSNIVIFVVADVIWLVEGLILLRNGFNPILSFFIMVIAGLLMFYREE